jgi:hypothetical protein
MGCQLSKGLRDGRKQHKGGGGRDIDCFLVTAASYLDQPRYVLSERLALCPRNARGRPDIRAPTLIDKSIQESPPVVVFRVW